MVLELSQRGDKEALELAQSDDKGESSGVGRRLKNEVFKLISLVVKWNALMVKQ